jgi:hypothetical protein
MDQFESYQVALDSPGDPVAVTPNDGADLPGGRCRGLQGGAAGNIVVVNAAGADITIASSAGQYHPIRTARVKATGTTATPIIAIY